jgi:YfiH family protein
MASVTTALIDPALGEIAGLSHGFFTRQGGVSKGTYASLNCGSGSNDDAADVAANRARAIAALGADGARLLTGFQSHTDQALEVTEAWPDAEQPVADGFATRTPGLALGILSADCAPVLFADAKRSVVGAAHAGWRGALSGVLEATVDRMVELGAQPNGIHAAVGPCIAKESYEVAVDYADRFLLADPANAAFFTAAPRTGRRLFDLAGYVAYRLSHLGLGQVTGIGGDTYADEARFFSYRRSQHRGETDYGRMLSVIVLDG